jgi:uncharacterized surface protein with fasciclin (FAS1) repeats
MKAFRTIKQLGRMAGAGAVMLVAAAVAMGNCGCTPESQEAGQKGSKDIVELAVGAGDFETLAAAAEAAGLIGALKGPGPFTVFAPTDAAFAKLPEGTVANLLKPENKAELAAILKYHVVPGRVTAAEVVKLSGARTLNGQRVSIETAGGKVKVDGANVTKTDIFASNGVIHVIDAVILPAGDDLVTTAVKAGSFKTLAAALKAADLVGTLQGEGPFTVFAPTDAAFANLPEGTLETLLAPENRDKLTAILTYHVVPGRVYAADALGAKRADTVGGPALRFAKAGGGVRVNGANVVQANIDAANGVIHVIDTVLLPPEGQAEAPSARREIVAAIQQGSQMYNAGHHGACADLYEQTALKLAHGRPSELTGGMRQHLMTSVERSRRMDSADARAWHMRHALDAALASLGR